MTESYDLRSNIKGKPGSQGTLFQVKDKGLLNPQQRWPKGYTPERIGEVRDALKDTSVSPPDHMYTRPEEDNQREHGVTTHGYRERVQESLAKTKVPAADLHGLKEINGSPHEGDAATYWFGSKRIGMDMTHEDAPRDLVHEIGHHADNMRGITEGRLPDMAARHAQADRENRGVEGPPTATDKAYARSRVMEGAMEGEADNYYTKHYRTWGRKGKADPVGRYQEMYNVSDLERHLPGYHDVRPPQHSEGVQKLLQGMQFKQGSLF